MKYINLNTLPRNKVKINWSKSVGCVCDFIYDDIKGEIEIIKFKRLNNRTYLTIKYESKTYDISSDNLCKCQIGVILNKYNGDFKINIGDVLKDNKRDITIIDKEYRKDKNEHVFKWYKYRCNKDSHEDWIVEHSLLKGIGCSVCSNWKIIKGINDIATTTPWMINYLANKEDAYRYSSCSGVKVRMKCPDCGRIKSMIIANLFKRHNISCICSDNKPYPEKFMSNVLEQINESFISQYSKSNCNWCGDRLYDFYSLKYNIIIETNGGQHSKDTTWKTKEKQQEIDRDKKELALNNGIANYIELDCRYSDKEYIKNSILNSELTNYFDFSNVDWEKADEFATKNLIKTVCEYYELNKGKTLLKDITKRFNISYSTFNKYIKQGGKFNWCTYDIKDNYKNIYKIIDNPKSKPIVVVETGDIFKSATECEQRSEELYGVKFHHNNISRVCSGKQNSHKGYHFRYAEEKE